MHFFTVASDSNRFLLLERVVGSQLSNLRYGSIFAQTILAQAILALRLPPPLCGGLRLCRATSAYVRLPPP